MYKQILTHKYGATVKILSHHQGIYIISLPDNHTRADYMNYTKELLIENGWIFPVETEKWTPEMQSSYFIPNVTSRGKYNLTVWANDENDKQHLANNLVCRTPAEAIALTDKMLGAVK